MENLKKSLKLSSLLPDECKIGISMPSYNYESSGYEIAQKLQQWLQEYEYKDIDVRYAGRDNYEQYFQISQMIEEGCNVIILWAVDGNEIGIIMDEYPDTYFIALYDLVYNTSGLKCLIAPDYFELGRTQGQYAKYILDPDFATEQLNIIILTTKDERNVQMYNGIMDVLQQYCDEEILQCIPVYVDDYASIFDAMGQVIIHYGDNFSAILCSSDGYVSSVNAALETFGGDAKLQGIAGCGGSNQALQDITSGQQNMTIKVLDDLALQTAEVLSNILDDGDYGTDIVDNGVMEVPVTRVHGEIVSDDDFSPGEEITYDLLRIEIESPPDKTEYYKYESFDDQGMQVRAYFSNGKDKLVKDYSYSPVKLELGTTSVTISYTFNGVTETAVQPVHVNNRVLTSITATPTVSYLLDGDELLERHFCVMAHFNEGESVQVYDFFLTDLSDNRIGEKTIEIDYYEGVKRFTSTTVICVYPKLTDISIYTLPNKLVYSEGERFNRTGLTIVANYLDGTAALKYSGNLVFDTNVIRFHKRDSIDFKVRYSERGVKAETSLTLYKKTGAQLDDCNTTQELDHCGTGTLNLYSGKLRYQIEDFSGTDAVMPISLYHIYHPDFDSAHGVGNCWRLNIQQEIVRKEGRWQYTDKEGKQHTFDSGYLSSVERSAIRNEKLGLDLFADAGNSLIRLIDRDMNTLVFSLMNGVYRLTELHRYPSRYESPIEAYRLKVEYTSEGNVSLVKGGRIVEGKQPTVRFIYANGRLSSLLYNFNGETTVARYVYNSDGTLKSIEKCNDNVESEHSALTEFVYEDGAFTVKNCSSVNGNGEKKTLKYTFDDKNRVNEFSVGYGLSDRETTTVSYYVSETPESERRATDVIATTRTTHNGTVSVVSFNSMNAVSQYSYELDNGGELKPKRVISAQSGGFDYRALADTYSDTLDIYHDDFENGKDGWSDGSLSNHAAVSEIKCLYGNSLSKTYTLDSSKIRNDTTVYLSFWLMPSGSANPEVTVKVSGSDDYTIQHRFDSSMKDRWQFIAFNLGKRKIGDKISLETEEDIGVYLDDVRLTKLPYETPDDIPDIEYDDFDKVKKSYQYNPIDGKISCTEYTYNTDHQITEQTETVDKKIINKVKYTYTDCLLTSKQEYGKSSSYTETCYGYAADKGLTSAEDSGGAVTEYREGIDWTETTVKGEENSPDVVSKCVVYPNSDAAKELSSGTYRNGFTYDSDGLLNKVKHNASAAGGYHAETSFTYDTYGNLSDVKIGTASLAAMEYDSKHLKKITYGNGDTVSYGYDGKDRLISMKENEADAPVTIAYGDTANESITVTHPNGLQYCSERVNTGGKTGTYEVSFGEGAPQLKAENYAAEGVGNKTSSANYWLNAETPFEKCETTKDRNGQITELKRSYHGGTNQYVYDNLYRLSKKKTAFSGTEQKISFSAEYEYQALSPRVRETERVKRETLWLNIVKKDDYSYEYYSNGNLAKIYADNALQNEYVYDAYDRLSEEYNYALQEVYQFTYDSGGNILEKKTFALENGTRAASPKKTDTYNYGTITGGAGQNAAWKDQLKSYNNQAIRYDGAGNPTSYRGRALAWNGRRLKQLDAVAMEYDYTGLRVKKGNKKYYWNNGNLITEQWEENGAEKYIYYYYDESGVSGMYYGGKEYYYRKNIFGDVLAIYDGNGTLQCRYVYDAWGNHKVLNADGTENASTEFIGNKNPFRYRSYYWDSEFALYYLKSRYYDPELGRFISADGVSYLNPESVAGLNLYAYCENNPVMGLDPDGTLDWGRIGRGLLIVAAAAAAIALTVVSFGAGSVISGVLIAGTIGVAGSLFSQTVIEGKEFSEVNYWDVAISGVSAAVSAIPGVGFAESIAISGVAGALSSLIAGDNPEDALLEGVMSAGITAIAGGISRGIGLGKISKIGKGKYANKKVFLNHVKPKRYKYKLSSFNPGVNKSQSLVGFIKNQVGIRGLSEISKESAGTTVNMLLDIASSIIP